MAKITREELLVRAHEMVDNFLDLLAPDMETHDGNVLVEELPEEVVKGNHVRMTMDVWLKRPDDVVTDKSSSTT